VAEKTFNIQGITIVAKGPNFLGQVEFKITLPSGPSLEGSTTFGASNVLNILRDQATPEEQDAIQAASVFITTQGPEIEKEIRAAAETAERAQADQGTKADSAGAIANEAAAAKDDNAAVQNPTGAPENIDADGNVSNTTTARPSNAEPQQPGDPSISPSPPKLPNTSTGTADTTTSNSLPGTPVTGSGVLQQAVPSDSQQFYVYKTVSVVSNFSGGKFTQDLEGVVLQIPINQVRRQDGVLVPVAADSANQADQIRLTSSANGTLGRSSTTATDPNTGLTSSTATGTNGDRTETGTNVDRTASINPEDGSIVGADPSQPDSTIYGPQQNSDPQSAGQDVSVPTKSTVSGEGSASTVVGGFTIKAVVGPDTGGAAYTVSRGGSTEFAFSAGEIFGAATKLILAGKGGDDQEVIAWVNARGPQQLEAQALAQVTPVSTGTNAVNLARES
jgi:hypothetical protein